MRRVHTIRLVRPFLSSTALSSLVIVLALWGIGREVWVARVFENMPSLADAAAVSQFVLSAFLHTDFVVQALSVVTMAAAVWLVRDALRTLTYANRFA